MIVVIDCRFVRSELERKMANRYPFDSTSDRPCQETGSSEIDYRVPHQPQMQQQK